MARLLRENKGKKEADIAELFLQVHRDYLRIPAVNPFSNPCCLF